MSVLCRLAFLSHPLMRCEVVHHLATNMDLYVDDVIPLVRGIYGAGDPLTTPQSICSYLQELLRINFWADEIVLRVLSLLFNVTITVIRGDSGREDRVRHSRDLSQVDIVLLLAQRGHYSPAGNLSTLFIYPRQISGNINLVHKMLSNEQFIRLNLCSIKSNLLFVYIA